MNKIKAYTVPMDKQDKGDWMEGLDIVSVFLRLCIANQTDSYKLVHWKIYPKKLNKMVSYLEARAPSGFSEEVVFFGLQYFIKRYLCGRVISERDLPRLKAYCKHHFYGVEGLFNEAGWRYIIEKHQGRLPVSIRAVAEGTVVPVGNVLIMIENTDPNCAWLTNFLETLLVKVWNTITVCSLSRAMKKTQYEFMKKSVEDDLIAALMPSRVHDFGDRGVSSPETAALSGAAHLVNFAGTDNNSAIELVNQFYEGVMFSAIYDYDANMLDKGWDYKHSYEMWDQYYAKHMPGKSIPATEHSQMTLGGPEGEADICGNLLKEFPEGFVACVSDSYDLFHCVNEIWGNRFRNQILERNGVLVIRPDSGKPTEIVPAILEALGDKFGFRINKKGYKVLNDKIRVIQGDGINVYSHREILKAIVDAGWSAENVAFGSGGGLLQQVNRDTFKFAFKCCYVEIDNIPRNVFKKPKTDPTKVSKGGILALVRDGNKQYKTVQEFEVPNYESGNLLIEVFRDGKITRDLSFDIIREAAELEELCKH